MATSLDGKTLKSTPIHVCSWCFSYRHPFFHARGRPSTSHPLRTTSSAFCTVAGDPATVMAGSSTYSWDLKSPGLPDMDDPRHCANIMAKEAVLANRSGFGRPPNPRTLQTTMVSRCRFAGICSVPCSRETLRNLAAVEWLFACEERNGHEGVIIVQD